MARKGIFSPDILPGDRTADTSPAPRQATPRGPVGAMQSSLARMQENAVQDIDAGLIDDAGVEDRLGRSSEAHRNLMDSLRTYGQQVPVLLRPHPDRHGRYQIVYGRRRLAALRELGLPVRAMVRQLDDQSLVMAQGQENTSRQDLSFIEKASFAAQLDAMGYDRKTICDALTIDEPMLSRMLRAGRAFPLELLRKIGPAPGIGRDRWLDLVRLLEDKGNRTRALPLVNTPDFQSMDSDSRFEALFRRAAGEPKPAAKARPQARTLRQTDGKALAEIKRSPRGVTLSIPARTAEGFEAWFDENAEELMSELHRRWQTSAE